MINSLDAVRVEAWPVTCRIVEVFGKNPRRVVLVWLHLLHFKPVWIQRRLRQVIQICRKSRDQECRNRCPLRVTRSKHSYRAAKCGSRLSKNESCRARLLEYGMCGTVTGHGGDCREKYCVVASVFVAPRNIQVLSVM